MRDALLVVMLLALIALGYVVTTQQRRINTLESRAKRSSLELQDRCSRQAALAFKNSGLAEAKLHDYENHYNEKLDRCLVLMRASDPAAGGEVFVQRFLVDAFENKPIGQFGGTRRGTTPDLCTVTMPSGEEKQCHTLDEFEELAKTYMQ
jgi:type II secretory pathway pseudopilin PulG